jgi:hypothetical protein
MAEQRRTFAGGGGGGGAAGQQCRRVCSGMGERGWRNFTQLLLGLPRELLLVLFLLRSLSGTRRSARGVVECGLRTCVRASRGMEKKW